MLHLQIAETFLGRRDALTRRISSRKRVPNLRRVTNLHPHLLHQSVEEVFPLRVETGLEYALEVVQQAGETRMLKRADVLTDQG
jgi:hypothetical protein